MQDHPSAADVLAQAIGHLRDEVAPSLEPRAQFELRVTISALQLVQRTLTAQAASDEAEMARLEALLGEAGDLETLNRRLAAAIREGAMTLSTPGLAAHLRATAMEKLAIDQPSYAAYQRALKS